jgi:hypothetical protein
MDEKNSHNDKNNSTSQSNHDKIINLARDSAVQNDQSDSTERILMIKVTYFLLQIFFGLMELPKVLTTGIVLQLDYFDLTISGIDRYLSQSGIPDNSVLDLHIIIRALGSVDNAKFKANI